MNRWHTARQRKAFEAVLDRVAGARSEIARSLGVHRSAVTLWLKHRFDSERIAAAVEKTVRDIELEAITVKAQHDREDVSTRTRRARDL